MPETTLQPSKSPSDLESERVAALMAKINIIREKARINHGEVYRLVKQGDKETRVPGGNPSRAYIWVNVDDSRRISYESLGYLVCKDPHIWTPWRREDGTHRRGDLVLYEIDKESSELIRMEAELRAIEDMEGSRESFLTFAARAGIPVTVQS